MKNCENCGKEHEGTYASGRFCSKECSKGFSTKNKRSLINENLRKKAEIKYPNIIKKCEWCHKEFGIKYKKRHQTACSLSCAAKLRSNTPEQKAVVTKTFSKSAIERYARHDTTIGWQSRTKQPMSRPEKIVYDILINEEYKFEREYKVGKYFIDFAFLNQKIALEIDGKQHKYEDRKQKDKEKDLVLQNNGWKIIRFPWKEKNVKEDILKLIESKVSR